MLTTNTELALEFLLLVTLIMLTCRMENDLDK